MTDQPDAILAPETEPTNSIDLLYGQDHPRELVDVLRQREKRMRTAGGDLGMIAIALLRRLEDETGLDWPDLRRDVAGLVASWREACGS